MSEVKVNKISPRSGTTVTLGDSGDTIAINSGASLTGFTSTGIDDNATSTAITIDSSENVGIGTSSPEATLEVGSGNRTALSSSFRPTIIVGTRPNGDVSQIDFNPNLGIGNGVTANVDASKNFTISTVTSGVYSERMRIDSSGNLFVNKTVDSIANNGFQFLGGSNNYLGVTRDGGNPLFLNRRTSDGDILVFRQDNADHGSIGTPFNNAMFICGPTSTGAGLIFQHNEIIYPSKNKVRSDNTIDLGGSVFKFKDFYLGGNIYLGGTTSANALDDYETGTFTVGTNGDATGAFSNETGEYTKIGNVVHVRIVFTVSTNFTNDIIDGLPFVPDHTTVSSSFLGTNAFLTLSNANGVIFGKIQDNNAELRLCENNDFDDAHSPNTVNSTYRISFWYYSV